MEKWIISSEHHNFADSIVGSPDAIVGLESGDRLRILDTTNFVVTYRGDAYPLKPIVDSIKDLYQKAVIEAQKTPW